MMTLHTYTVHVPVHVYKATPSCNPVSGRDLSLVKMRARGFTHYVIMLHLVNMTTNGPGEIILGRTSSSPNVHACDIMIVEPCRLRAAKYTTLWLAACLLPRRMSNTGQDSKNTGFSQSLSDCHCCKYIMSAYKRRVGNNESTGGNCACAVK